MTQEYEKLNAEFDEIKAAAHTFQPLPKQLERSTACVGSYYTLRGIYFEQHLRKAGKEELTARGRAARKLFIDLRRDEMRIREAAAKLHDTHMRAGQLSAKLIKWQKTDDDGAALIDTLQEYIHALTGEDTPVTARFVCDVLRRELLTKSELKAAASDTPKKKAKKFVPPALEEVRAYWQEEGLKGDPEEFFDHFRANSWKQANGNKLVDWHAAARNWSRKESKFVGNAGGKKNSTFSSDASYDLEAYRMSAIGLRDYEPKEKRAGA